MIKHKRHHNPTIKNYGFEYILITNRLIIISKHSFDYYAWPLEQHDILSPFNTLSSDIDSPLCEIGEMAVITHRSRDAFRQV